MRARGRAFHRKNRPFARPAIFIIFFCAFPAYMRVGLYFRGCHRRFARYQPPKTKPCFREFQKRTARKSSPQGVTIPNAFSPYLFHSFFVPIHTRSPVVPTDPIRSQVSAESSRMYRDTEFDFRSVCRTCPKFPAYSIESA